MSFDYNILICVLAVPAVYYVILPPVLAHLPRPVQFLAKMMVIGFSGLVMSVAGCVIAIVFSVIQKRHAINRVVSRIYPHFGARLCGLTFHILGEEHLSGSPSVIVCNHQSTMDLMVISRIFPSHCVIMAKKELVYIPILGIFTVLDHVAFLFSPAVKLSNAIFIDRKNHQKAIESTSQAVADMEKNKSGIWIFPEGTRSHFKTADLLPFKKGAFHLAIQAQLPVTPVITANYSHIYDSSKLSFPGGELNIRVLEPIPTTGLTADDVNMLMDKTRDLMLQHLTEMEEISQVAATSGGDKKDAAKTNDLVSIKTTTTTDSLVVREEVRQVETDQNKTLI
ncbi:1-acylglycerol-3-phosphate O-acyltransferase [Podila epigama]|nr:1-acylglycerol-3-phosphate O-acyltransferase [Podila epigama]